eukprot:6378988-Lingulodinium_polyedra.AAC.1
MSRGAQVLRQGCQGSMQQRTGKATGYSEDHLTWAFSVRRSRPKTNARDQELPCAQKPSQSLRAHTYAAQQTTNHRTVYYGVTRVQGTKQ